MMAANELNKITTQDYIVSIDLGTSEIKVCSAILYDDDSIKIIGYGKCKTTGMNADGIVSMDKLKENISIAYNMSHNTVTRSYDENTLPKINNPRVFVSVPGRFITYKNNTGSCELRRGPITEDDIARANDVANSLKIKDYELITAIPNYYQVDSNERVEDPLDMTGGQLRSFIHQVYAQTSFLDNIRRSLCCIETEYAPEFVFSGQATAYVATTDTEKKFGVCVLDIGKSSTGITIFDQGHCIYVGSCPYGADKITQNIAVTYGLSERTAEKLKCDYGFAISNNCITNKCIRMDKNGQAQARSINQGDLAESIEAGYSQLIMKVLTTLNEVNVSNGELSLGAGFVITGGGAEIKCLDECVSKIFTKNGLGAYAKKIRIHQVDKEKIEGLSDAINPYSGCASLGLIRFSEILESHKKAREQSGMIGNLKQKITEWWNGNM